jgi:hypothetical protein
MKILVADTRVTQHGYARNDLTGHEVVAVANSETAAEAIANAASLRLPIEAVLTDVAFPYASQTIINAVRHGARHVGVFFTEGMGGSGPSLDEVELTPMLSEDRLTRYSLQVGQVTGIVLENNRSSWGAKPWGHLLKEAVRIAEEASTSR